MVMICYNVDHLGISCGSMMKSEGLLTWSALEHRSVRGFTNDPFHFPCEHILELLIHLGEISPVRCGRLEVDTRHAIVE